MVRIFSLATDWVWDFWLADDGEDFHVFFLHAPRSAEEDRRHRTARIGHAVSADLRQWQLLADVFGPGPAGAFDESVTWTGSVARGDDKVWRMFYTGASFLADWPDPRNRQTVGVAVSTDLHHWEKRRGPVVTMDGRWYERFGSSGWHEEVWRDPWVYRDHVDGRWHMLTTARANYGDDDDRGVIGHAVSGDLETWTVLPPVTAPGIGFSHMEVPQLIAGPRGNVILFSCPTAALSARAQAAGATGGIWAMPLDLNAPERAATDRPVLLTSDALYAGKIVLDRSGAPQFLAIINRDESGAFVGALSDPAPVGFDDAGLPCLDLPAPSSSVCGPVDRLVNGP